MHGSSSALNGAGPQPQDLAELGYVATYRPKRPDVSLCEPRIEILLSTYNGGRYLPDLLRSLCSQQHRNARLRVRDDGSADDTLGVLAAFAARQRMSVDSAPHVGVPESFFRLLRESDEGADLFCFCDQDDVWFPTKLAEAAAVFGTLDPARPALYCTSLQPVDASLRPFAHGSSARRGLGLRNALVENRAPGCTLVINRAARNLLSRCAPHSAMMHDHWCYLVVSAFGTVHYDPHPSLLYRQHPGNRLGIPRGWWARARGLRRRGGMRPFFDQAEEFWALYGHMLDAGQRAILERFLGSRYGLGRRLAYALRPETYRQSRLDDVIHRALIALGFT